MENVLSKVIGDGLESRDCYKGTPTKDVFLGISKNFQKGSSCEHPFKRMHEMNFCNSV